MNISTEMIQIEYPLDHVLRVTLNRPEVANAANTQMTRELISVLRYLEEEEHDIRCMILTGAGDRAFCAGGDMKERRSMSENDWSHQHRIIERMVRCFLDCPIPVIAAINGAAYAGGLEMAMCCDLIYAADHARFALTETSLGIMPGAGGTQNLARRVGVARAKEIILTAQPFSAAQAREWGLVLDVFPTADLASAVLVKAERIAGNAPLSVRQAKHAIQLGSELDLASGLRFEIEAYNKLITSQDRQEGVRAFAEKRKPRFVGR